MIRVMTLAAVAVMAASTASAQNYPWKPEKPITLIVPWAAGGSTDQVSRVAAAEIERVLGQKVVVVNQGGASGSIGTRNVLQAAPDGYTWAAGAAKDLGTYAVSGMLDTKIATGGSISASSTCRCSRSATTRPTRRRRTSSPP